MLKHRSLLVLTAIVIAISCNNQKAVEPKEAVRVDIGNAHEDSAKIPLPKSFVNDLDNILTDSQEVVLDSICSAFEKQTTGEIAIYSFDSLKTSREGFEKYTLSILNTGGIGKKIKNNGLLIAVCKDYQKMRIENGYGIERILSNSETKEIIDRYFLPHFRHDQYYKGILNGLLHLTEILPPKMKRDSALTF